MPIVVSPPPPKQSQRFDDWMFLFWRRAFPVADSDGAVRVDATNPALIYRGTATTGTAESSAAWIISKIIVYGADQVAVSQAAGLNAWDDRAILTYV